MQNQTGMSPANPLFSFLMIAEPKTTITLLVSSIELFRRGCESLSGPLDIVRSLHNAFRRDIFQIDDSVLKIARGGGI